MDRVQGYQGSKIETKKTFKIMFFISQVFLKSTCYKFHLSLKILGMEPFTLLNICPNMISTKLFEKKNC